MVQPLPQALIDSLQDVKGFTEETFKQVHASGAQLTSIRMNPAKIRVTSYSNLPHNRQALPGQQEQVPWCNQGYYLNERPSFTADPLFHAGAYYVQEASSMFLEQALQQTVDLYQPIKILDLCAAPGGKSTLIQSLITNESVLVSNEVIKARVNILSENITKWGAANVIVTNNDPKDFQRLQNYFDVIVVDAPCSGSGLFRKDASAIEEWSMNNVQLCSQRQQRILSDIMPALKENGVLLYSTCSYSEAEDETISDWLVEECNVASLPLHINGHWGIVTTTSPRKNAFGYRFYPDKVKGEGFFIAAFKKNAAGNDSSQEIKVRNKPAQPTSKEIEIAQPWLKTPEDFFFIKQNDDIIAMPPHLHNEWPLLQASLYIKKAGVRLGTVIRDELIPHHELALSTVINAAIPCITADEATALQYLRKQEININTSLKGWALIQYQHLALGWVKILSNRINNYYPKEWRILNK